MDNSNAFQYASKQKTMVLELSDQFDLKRNEEGDPRQIIFDDQGFRDSLLKTMENIRAGKTRWLHYDDVFE
jgi:hypothetical protein